MVVVFIGWWKSCEQSRTIGQVDLCFETVQRIQLVNNHILRQHSKCELIDSKLETTLVCEGCQESCIYFKNQTISHKLYFKGTIKGIVTFIQFFGNPYSQTLFTVLFPVFLDIGILFHVWSEVVKSGNNISLHVDNEP